MSELLGIARFKFQEGKRDEYKRLSAQAMEVVRTKDTGTLQYDISLNDDESECTAAGLLGAYPDGSPWRPNLTHVEEHEQNRERPS